MDNIWIQIAAAAFMGLMIVRMIPAAKHWLEHGPRGTAKQWLDVSLLALGVVIFVAFLVSVVRG